MASISYLDRHQLRQFSSIPQQFLAYRAKLFQAHYQVGAEIPLWAVKPQSRRKTLNVLKQLWETLQNLWPLGACERFMRLEGFWGAFLCGLLQVAPWDHSALLAGINMLLELMLLWVSEWQLTSSWGIGQFCCRAATRFCDPLHPQRTGRPLADSVTIAEDWYSVLENNCL